MRRLTLPACAAALVLCAAPGTAPAADTGPAFLSQDEVTLPDRSRVIDRVDRTGGCGAPPAAGRIAVDGRGGDWQGDATMISGSGRYDRGEYVWTDYAYDDDGTGRFQYPGEGEPLVASPGTVGKGSPRQQRYGSNAADVVELRATADGDYVYLLVRFNFMNATDATALGLAFDLDRDAGTGLADWPHGARMRTPGTDLFLTAHGDCALVRTSAGEIRLDEAGGAIRVGTAENVFEIALPRTLLGGAPSVRLAGGSGLWDPGAGAWMAPRLLFAAGGNASDSPAGAQRPSDPAVFNLLFRDDEGLTGSDSQRAFQSANQHATLSGGTSGSYAVALDLARLEPEAPSDPLPVRRGDDTAFTRLYRSRIDAEGVLVQGQFAVFLGRYQPYGVYLPACFEEGCDRWPGERPSPMVIVHGGGGTHIASLPGSSGGSVDGVNDLTAAYAAMDDAFAPLVVTALGRGQRPPWWRGYGEADVLELREASQRAYGPDPERWVITGGSLGGYSTIRLASLYPELWAGAVAHCPAEFENSISGRYVGNVDPATQPFVIDPVMPGMLNVPFRQVNGTADPLVPIVAGHRLRETALAAGLDYRYTEYLAGGHCWDNAAGARTWVANHAPEYEALASRDRAARPARVRYAVDPRHYPAGPEPIAVTDIRDLGIRYDRAYWISGLAVRSEDAVASIDVASHALAGRQTRTEGCGEGVGLGGPLGGNPDLAPGTPTPHTYLCRSQARAGADGNMLDLATRNLEAATIDVAGAGIDTGLALRITAKGDGPFRVTLDGFAAARVEGDCVTGHELRASATDVSLELGPEPCTLTLDP